MKFDYYYGSQADQFSFIKIPKAMLIDKTFSPLSLQSKMLYGILLDRLSLSRKNGWFDSENKAYIIYQISEIQEDLGFSKKKAIDYLSELEDFGLVEKKRRGRGLPSILYVKSFQIQNNCKDKATVETKISAEKRKDVLRSVDCDTSRSSDMSTSRSSEHEPLEVSISTPPINKNKIINTEESNNKSNHIVSEPELGKNVGYECDMMREANAYEEIIKENIRYDDLLTAYPYEKETIEGIKQLILETVLNKGDSMVIASNTYPISIVKSKFLKLNYSHIEYVMDCLNANASKVKNIKKYLLAALFNATSTMCSFYRAEVNHDMAYAL